MALKPPFPKEHGVWAMLGTAYAAGALAGPTLSIVTVTTALGLAFLLALKAPLTQLVRLGNRREPLSWLVGYFGLGLLFMLPLLSTLPSALVFLAGGVVLLAAPAYLSGLRRRREMKIMYELPAMALLSLAGPFGYVSSGGLSPMVITVLWICLLSFYWASSFRVRCTAASRTRKIGLAYNLLVLATVSLLTVGGLLPLWFLAAYAPLLEDALRTVRPRKETISFLGRLELVKTLTFALFLVPGLRLLP